MKFKNKIVSFVLLIAISILVVSCDSVSDSTESTTIQTTLTTTYQYYSEFNDLYNMDLYDVTITEVNDGSTNKIYTLINKNNDEVAALIYEVQAEGYMDTITMLIAINNDYTVEGYYVVEHGESPGFGAEIVDNDFNVINITEFTNVDNVSGASYTASAIDECFLTVKNRIESDLNS